MEGMKSVEGKYEYIEYTKILFSGFTIKNEKKN
jgi:hypothetical protein